MNTLFSFITYSIYCFHHNTPHQNYIFTTTNTHKMNFRKISLLRNIAYTILAALTITACGSDGDGDGDKQQANINKNTNYTDRAATRIEVPHLRGGNSKFIVYRVSDTSFDKDGVNYCVEWDRDLKANRWTSYILTKANITKHVSRWYASQGELQYPFDTQNLTLADYYTDSRGSDLLYGSGFDHGHLCPSNDRLYSTAVNKQTFNLTNMQPQFSVFNGSDRNHPYSGLWIDIENKINNFISGNSFTKDDTLFICKGGTIDSEDQILSRIQNKVIVPKYFYAAVVWKRTKLNLYSGIAFWCEHTNVYHGNEALRGYAISIGELEKKLGGNIDFFCNLPDEIEKKVEKTAATLDFGL